MSLARYEKATVLSVDYRYETEFPRVKTLLEEKGIKHVRAFIDGQGELLPRKMYGHISTPMVAGWPESYGAYSQFGAIKNMINEYLKSDVREFLFCEDDLIFRKDFDEIVGRAHEQIPDDWDMIYYGANHSGFPTKQISENVLKLNGSKCTHCVAIKRTVFEEIANFPPIVGFDTSVATRIHPAYNCYGVWPSVALQKPGYSVIWRQSTDYTKLFDSRGIVDD